MINPKLRIVAVALSFLMVFAMTSCVGKDTDVQKEDISKAEGSVESKIIATKGNLSLEWDDDSKCLLFKDAASGKIWSTTPYDFYKEGKVDEDLSSPIFIDFVNVTTKLSDSSKGYSDAIENGRVTAKEITDGIEVCYHFTKQEISIPVEYTLRQDSFAISIDFSRVEEGQNQLRSVSIAPFLTSITNNSQDSYIFVPSGSGALMYPNENTDGARGYSGEVYGRDASQVLPEMLTDDEPVRLPVFGAKEGENALLAIIEQGAESAVINAEAGSILTGYTNAYVTFNARGFDVYDTQLSWDYKDITRVSKDVTMGKFTVGFYPLEGEDANYIGMANRYRKYLIDNNGLSKTEENGDYALYITGGANVSDLMFGIPYSSTLALTTFSQAKDIIFDLKESSGLFPAVKLSGFTESGLTYKKIGGGYGFSSVFGSNKDRLDLEDECRKVGIPLYTNFELLYFTSTGNGFNTLLDVAKSASLHKVKNYFVEMDLRDYDKESGYFLLKRSKLDSAINKLIKCADKKDISAVSLDSLFNTAYSDYSNAEYAGKSNMAKDVTEYIKKLKDSKLKVAASGANVYAAAAVDCNFEVPVDSGNYRDLSVDVPFYQFVFKGYKPIYSENINTAANPQKQIMLSVSSGTSLGFSLIKQYNNKITDSHYNGLYASEYQGNKELILNTLQKTSDFYRNIKNVQISEYEFLENNVTKTVFSNGTVVYANHSDKPVSSSVGNLQAYGFLTVVGECVK